MSLLQIRKDMQELKNIIISETQPAFKIFIFRGNESTDEGETEEDLKAYVTATPSYSCVKTYS
jgi:hypothetical protein